MPLSSEFADYDKEYQHNKNYIIIASLVGSFVIIAIIVFIIIYFRKTIFTLRIS